MKLVFDIGGTNMRVAASANSTDIAEPIIVATPAWADAPAKLKEVLAQAAQGGEVEAVLGGVAGVVHEGALLRASRNMQGWEDADLMGVLRGLYPNARVVVENDAAVACLGEAHMGAGRGSAIVAYLTVGTGVGGACAINGALEPRSAGYEPGNEIIDLDTGATVEALASGRAITEKYGTRIGEAPEDAQERAAHALATMAHNAVAFWSPDVIVFGGGVIAGNPGYFERIERHYQALPPIVPAMPPLKKGALGDRAGLIGALRL